MSRSGESLTSMTVLAKADRSQAGLSLGFVNDITGQLKKHVEAGQARIN